jgi:hypothetical protein
MTREAPRASDLDVSDLSLGPSELGALLGVDSGEWRAETALHTVHIDAHPRRYPFELKREHARFARPARGAASRERSGRPLTPCGW